MLCHLALGWGQPIHIIDLFAEFRRLTNGLDLPCGAGLLGALTFYGVPSASTAIKDAMRDIAIRGAPFTDDEREALLNYCQSDVEQLALLMQCMGAAVIDDLELALLRGGYMGAAARIEWNGIPIDAPALEVLREKWPSLRQQLIKHVDNEFDVFEGEVFREDKFAKYLARHRIPWPRLPSGRLALDDKTFRDMARAETRIAPLQELRASLALLRVEQMEVGNDDRNRTMLSAFRSKTGRNQPSTTRGIFGAARWIRGLIRPHDGFGIAYIDWSQQEFGIGAALSEDGAMMAAYSSGDPYLAFARQAGLAPADATKQSHPLVRERCKAAVLAVQYTMGAESLAIRLGIPVAGARDLLELHRRTYAKFWRWSDASVDIAMLQNHLWTSLGWEIRVGPSVNPRSLRNFPMQANGADMLRLATIFAIDAGVRIAMPVHDALLIEAPLTLLDEHVHLTKRAMRRASSIVLNGFDLNTDARTVRSPDRFMDERGQSMWSTVWKMLDRDPDHLSPT